MCRSSKNLANSTKIKGLKNKLKISYEKFVYNIYLFVYLLKKIIITTKTKTMQTLIIELENKFTGELVVHTQKSTDVSAFKESFMKGTKTMKWLMGDWNLSRCYIAKN